MRIIAGSAKGRRLKGPRKTSGIRPILGRMRQSLFDTIRPKVVASHFLDLYAGTGTVGLEALSRGAQLVVFVDKTREALRLIESNVVKTGFKDRAVIQSGDVLGAALVSLRAKLPSDIFFDLVFSAPPYLGDDRRGSVLVMSIPTLKKLAVSELLAPGAWVILQHHQKESWENLPQGFRKFKEAKFGESILTYLQWD